MIPGRTESHPAMQASFLAILAGILIFISPWVYGGFGTAMAWNTWIVSAAIMVFAAMRIRRPAEIKLSRVNEILGLWICVSPWVYRYTGTPGGRINSLCAGFFVFCAAVIAANSQKMNHDLNSTSM